MWKLIVVVFVLLVLFISACAGGKQKSGTLSERAKKAWIAERDTTDAEHELIRREKLIQVFRILRTSAQDAHGKSIYEQIKHRDMLAAWDEIDSIIQAYYQYMDTRNNPDTPENEWYQNLQKRIDWCDQFAGKWWQTDDRRAYVAIQLGVKGLNYSWEYEGPCVSSSGELKNRGKCIHCQMSYPRRGTYIQLQGNEALGYFDQVVAWIDKDDPAGHSRYSLEEIQTRQHLAIKTFQQQVTNREQPPQYQPLPEADKDLDMAMQIFQRKVGDNIYEVWSTLALPLDQFDADSNGTIAFRIEQVIRSSLPPYTIKDSSATETVRIPKQQCPKGSYYFAALNTTVKPGTWQIVVTPQESGTDNKTIYSIDLEIPGHSVKGGISDIVMYYDQQTGKQNQLEINGTDYTALPFRSFRRSDSLKALVTNYDLPARDSSLVVWYLSPVQKRKRIGRTNVVVDSIFWSQMNEQEFPVLQFLEKSDIVIGFERTVNKPVFTVESELSNIPPGEYTLKCLVIEPRLRIRQPAREVSTRIMVK